MSCSQLKKLVLCLALVTLLAGCYPTKPVYLNDTGDLSYYLERATEIEYPDVQSTPLAEVTQSGNPITVVDPEFHSFFDLSLEEAVSMALQNSKVIRGYGTPGLQGTRVSPGIDNLANGSAGAGTFYNVAVRETEPGFLGTAGQLASPSGLNTNTGLDSNQGVEAALAEFDAQFTSNLFWNKSDEPRNVQSGTAIAIDRTNFQQDQVQFQNELSKKTASGTQLLARQINIYTANNIPLATDPISPGFQVLPSWWRTALEFEVRQPLLRGRGAFVNRMPVVISRINSDQELANLEAQLQNMVTNVEIRYWELYCAYRNLEAAKTGRNASLETVRIVTDQYNEGANVNIQQVAQASEQYHFFQGQVIQNYNTLLTAEGNLRYLIGIAATDGQIIRPIDEPIVAPVEFDWCCSMDEALTYKPELRQSRWELKKRELAVQYAKNSLLPELNVTGLYRFLGLGDRLVSDADNTPNYPNPGSGSLDGLWEGDYQEFQLGAEYRMPIGFRLALSNVRNAQLKLAREHARLEDQELDTSRELTEAFRALAANRELMRAAFNQWSYTKLEEEHFEELKDAGVTTLDVALDSQRRRAQAESAFYDALCEYNKTIALIHRRKGTILAYNSIDFGEGPWTGKAYLDASENARRRSAGRELNYGWTRPDVISAGSIWPGAENNGAGVNYNQTIPATRPEEIESLPVNSDVQTAPYFEQSSPSHASEMYDPNVVPPLTLRTPVQGPSTIRDPEVVLASHLAPENNSILQKSIQRTMGSSHVAHSSTRQAEHLPNSEQTASVDWGRFGMEAPSRGPQGVRASIRINGSTARQ